MLLKGPGAIGPSNMNVGDPARQEEIKISHIHMDVQEGSDIVSYRGIATAKARP